MADRKELKHLRAVEEPAEDEKLAEVIAKITPLPRDLAPSDEFIRRTRLQLLNLPPPDESADQRAA